MKSAKNLSPPLQTGRLSVLPKPRNAYLLPALGLLLLTLLAYSNSFGGGFVLDNRGLLLHDQRLREASAENVGLIFQHTYWWPNGESGLYRPFTTLSYLFNYAVLGNGEAPGGYHGINFLLHGVNVLLVYGLTVRLIKRTVPAFFISALWAVHPILTEAVTNIAGRADLLAAAGVLGGLLAYLNGVKAQGGRQFAWFAVLAVVTSVGVFSKESAVVLPGVILLYEFVFRQFRGWARPQTTGLIATLIPVALMLYVRHHVLAGTLPMEIPYTDNPIAWEGFLTGRLTALYVIARYTGLLIWPVNLSVDYSWRQIPLLHGFAGTWIIGFAALTFIPLMALLYRWNRAVFFLSCLGLAWLAPVSNLLFPIGTIMAERFLYLPALGFIAFVVLALYAIGEKTRTARFLPALLCLVAAALAVRTLVRNRDWKDDMSIASASVLTSPQSFKTHDLLANVLFASDPSHTNIDRVIEQSERSLAILDPLPDEYKPEDPYRFAATCYMNRGAYKKAIEVLTKLIAIEKTVVSVFASKHPTAKDSLALDSLSRASNLRQAGTYLLLSAAYAEAGEANKAADAAGHAGALDPLSPQLYRRMADLAMSGGRMDEAAIALVEGTFITSDKSLRKALVELYQKAMSPGSCVLMSGPNGPAINPACGKVHEHVCAASAPVVRTLAAAQQWELAQIRKKMFIKQFGCPNEPLDGILRL